MRHLLLWDIILSKLRRVRRGRSVSSLLFDHFIHDFLLSSLFILPYDFLFQSLSLLISLVFLFFFLLVKIKASRFKSFIIYDVLFNKLIWSYSFFTHIVSPISWKFLTTLFLHLIVIDSWRDLLYISWIRTVQLVSGVKRRLAFVIKVLVQIDSFACCPLLHIGVDLCSIFKLNWFYMMRVFDSILHVSLVLTFESLRVPLCVWLKKTSIGIIMLIYTIEVFLWWMNFSSSSLQKADSGVFFVEILLVLLWKQTYHFKYLIKKNKNVVTDRIELSTLALLAPCSTD